MDDRRRRVRTLATAPLVAVIMAIVACAAPATVPSPSASGVSVASMFPEEPSPSAAAVTPAPSPASAMGEPLGAAGTVVVLGNDGSLTLVEADGRSVSLASAVEGSFAFPAWSPDGSRIAAVRNGPTGNAIVVFDVTDPGRDPVAILESAAIGPFYLSWTPDGERVSYLANESGGLSLRVAPADGSDPLDGSSPDATIGSGSPFYFDWIDDERLLAHVGVGAGAFVGELVADGSSEPGPGLGTPGDFRSAVVSPDGSRISYARATGGGTAEVVLSGRDGSDERTMPLFGYGAMAFDPTGDTLAAIGPSRAGESSIALPVGPIRLMGTDPSSDRTLLDGSLVSFWWSPDGTTIAALRVQPVGATEVSSSAAASPSPDSLTEVRFLFVDVASGDVMASTVVVPGQLFIDQLLTYFDQYALSHDLWSPDSRSFLLPVRDAVGRTQVAVMPRDGGEPTLLPGQIAFWSP